MKRVIFSLIIILLNIYVTKAQDILVKNDGESLKVYNVEYSSKYVFYQLENNDDAEINRILKTDVLIIRKEDGTKIDPNVEESQATNREVPNERPYGLHDNMPEHIVTTAELCSEIEENKNGKFFFAKNQEDQVLKYVILSEEEKTVAVIYQRSGFSEKTKYNDKKYVIPDYVNINSIKYSVVEIGMGAFYCSDIEEVVFPKTLKVISESAFSNANLKSIILPLNIEEVKEKAFYRVGRGNGISELFIPKTIKTLGKDVFLKAGTERSFRGFYQGYISCLPDFITITNCTNYGLDEEALQSYYTSLLNK